MDINKVKYLLSDDMDEGIREIERILDSEAFGIVQFNDFIQLRGRRNAIKKDRTLGIIPDDQFYLQNNQIQLGLIGFLDSLAVVYISQLGETPHEKKPLSESSGKPFPRLELELVFLGKRKSPRGLSRNNTIDESGAVWLHQALFITELTWESKLILRNNSSIPAFKPKLIFSKKTENFDILEKLNPLEPVPPLSSKEINTKYKIMMEATGKDAYAYFESNSFPDHLEIIINYEDESSTPFFNLFQFDGKENSNKMIEKIPSDF